MAVLDETACQNTPNTSRVLYESGTKNTMTKIPNRIKTNMIGYQAINCQPYIESTKKSNAYTFLISLCHFRILNSENEKFKKIVEEAINNPNLTEEYIINEISENLSTDSELINKINDKLYDKKPKDKSLKSIIRICNKENPNNQAKIERRKRTNINKNLKNPEIKELASQEKTINLVLDNARIHSAVMVQEGAKILNINLIFLRPYCPDLNPIEDVWRVIKKTVNKTSYESEEELIELFINKFYEVIGFESFYDNWLELNGINF